MNNGITERLAKLETITLSHGSHESFGAGVCAMEAVAWLAGEPHSDAPECACPVITRAVQLLNDSIPTDEMRNELLRPLLSRLIGSRAPHEVMVKRGFVAADMACRVFAPMALKALGYVDLAARARGLLEVTDRETALRARDLYRSDVAVAAAAHAAADAARRKVFVEGVRMVEKMLDIR